MLLDDLKIVVGAKSSEQKLVGSNRETVFNVGQTTYLVSRVMPKPNGRGNIKQPGSAANSRSSTCRSYSTKLGAFLVSIEAQLGNVSSFVNIFSDLIARAIEIAKFISKTWRHGRKHRHLLAT